MTRATASKWISLGRACEMLGVNESTLRHWADSGRLRTFRTPGGHRRFFAQDIEGFIGSSATGAVVPEGALSRMRRRLNRRRAGAPEMGGSFDDAARARLRVLGRRMVALASEWAAAARPRPELSEEARYLGGEYGRELAAGGVGPRDAVAAFIFFRNTLLDSLTVPSQAGRGPTSRRSRTRYCSKSRALTKSNRATCAESRRRVEQCRHRTRSSSPPRTQMRGRGGR